MNQNKKLNLNFVMAKYSCEDQVLRAIAEEAVNFLLEHVDANEIQCLLLTGSVANGEGTVIKNGSSLITSDFDFVVYLNLSHFFRKSRDFQRLSHEISAKLKSKGLNAHILFLPSSSVISNLTQSVNPNIYKYEFAFASKCILGKKPSFDKLVRPSKRDALELVFTVVSDLVFSKFKEFSKIEESYNYAKRALTLLNSILIFHGFFAETYTKRMDAARKYASTGAIPLSEEEIGTLDKFTEYKLSGSYERLLGSLSYKEISDLVSFERKFLAKLAAKILRYELMHLNDRQTETSLACNDQLNSEMSKLVELFKEYSEHSKIRILPRIIGVTIYVVGLVRRDQKRKDLFATCLFYNRSPKVVLNELITFTFICGGDASAKILRKAFPWITFDDGQALQRMFSLWQFAEQAIKLG